MADEDARRSDILQTLRLLASPMDQFAYQERVPYVFVPAEMVCSWFDDCYVEPTAVDTHGQLPKSVHRQWFERLFSTEELQAIDEFSHVFDASVRALPPTLPRVQELNNLPEWKSVVAAAQNALRKFDDRRTEV